MSQSNEEQWREKFFADFFLKSPVIYTVFGTKPMSGITLDLGSEEDWVKSYASLLQNESDQRKAEIVQQIKEFHQFYDLPQNWEKWMVWRKDQPHSPFLFLKKEVADTPNLFNAYIINVQLVAWTLQKHYGLFVRELQMDFDPLEVALEFEDSKSIFWEKAFANHLLQGILHGYGERNAYFFSLIFHDEKKVEQATFCSRPSTDSDIQMHIPLFKSFDPPYGKDPIVIKYERERIEIQKRLKGKDGVKEVLNRLYPACK